VETAITFNGSAELDGAFKIYGGTAADTLTRGAGNDIFYYDDVSQSTPAAADNILDFTSGDKIDLHAIDAITGGADDAFSFVGNAAFSNHAGELRAVNTSGSNWLIQGDTNGDGRGLPTHPHHQRRPYNHRGRFHALRTGIRADAPGRADLLERLKYVLKTGLYARLDFAFTQCESALP
jgi:hypothetical protein